MMLASALFLSAVAQLGPGAGPWRFSTPEQQGLSSAALQQAGDSIEDSLAQRVCYIVVKNGVIVHEDYYQGWEPHTTKAAWSATKSLCSELFGIAEQQGWANRAEMVRSRNRGTRQCNENATFENVLTMTGESVDLNNPTYRYDTLGTSCLDTIQDFIEENNLDGLSAQEWKNRYFQGPLGLEHMTWGTATNLPCGRGAQSSCRDLARTGQFWANHGALPSGQVGNPDFFAKGSTPIFPDSGRQYGYTVGLAPSDPVDPEAASFIGLGAQCVIASRAHNAVIISMGSSLTESGCGTVWSRSRDAIVSSFNATVSGSSFNATK